MIIRTQDNGGVARMLDRLMKIYGVSTREEALARGVAIAKKLADCAGPSGDVIIRDMSQKTSHPISLPVH